MFNKVLMALIFLSLCFAGWQYYQVQQLEQELSVSRLQHLNDMAEMDSVRQTDSTHFARLTKQFNDINEETSKELYKLSGIVRQKNTELQAMAKINGELNLHIDTIRAEFREELNRFYFMQQTDDYYIVGTVSVDSIAPIAYIYIDSLTIPINIDIMFIKYTNDETIELQINTNNRFIKINNIESFIKVPPRVDAALPTWGIMAGPMFGQSYGILGGIRYKRVSIVGQMLNDRYGFGALWNF